MASEKASIKVGKNTLRTPSVCPRLRNGRSRVSKCSRRGTSSKSGL